MPHRKFNKLQDEYFEVSKRMHEAKTVQEKMTLLNELHLGGADLIIQAGSACGSGENSDPESRLALPGPDPQTSGAGEICWTQPVRFGEVLRQRGSGPEEAAHPQLRGAGKTLGGSATPDSGVDGARSGDWHANWGDDGFALGKRRPPKQSCARSSE
jgi:hypothetical protein